VQDVFASDGFVRGHAFHGKQVLTYSEACARYPGERIVLLSFASSRPDVLETIDRVAASSELYVPDVPVSGSTLFDATFYDAHRDELDAARALLSDEESRAVFDDVVTYKITGDPKILRRRESTPEQVFRSLLHPQSYRAYADLGAYNGDSIRALLPYAPELREVLALEPDARNFRKLDAYAASEERCHVRAVHAAAWCESTTLAFDSSGNRNAAIGGNGLQSAKKTVPVDARPLDALWDPALHLDYLKYDVEGAEAEALQGSAETIRLHRPEILLSLYHRSEDLYALPLLARSLYGPCRMYLRRFPYLPAWDLNLYVLPQ
jgi:FkbM family methyltransferase